MGDAHMSSLIISQCDDRRKKKEATRIHLFILPEEKDHRTSMSFTCCLLFVSSTWHLLVHLDVYGPFPFTLKDSWKHPSGLDFSAAWSPLSNNWALIPHVMCTHAVHKHIRWMKANHLKASRKWCSSQQNVHIKLWHCILAKVQSHPWLKHRDSEMERSKIQ